MGWSTLLTAEPLTRGVTHMLRSKVTCLAAQTADPMLQCREGKSVHWTPGCWNKDLPHHWAAVASFVWAWVAAAGWRSPVTLMDVSRTQLVFAQCWQRVLFTGSKWAGSGLVGQGSIIPTIRATTGGEPKWLKHIGLSLSCNPLCVLFYTQSCLNTKPDR